MQRPTIACPRCLVLMALAALTCGLGPAPAAVAQGTSGELPDPISSRDLDRYSRRLGLSDQQRQAIEVLHSDYQLAFRSLREGPIEEYLQEYGGSGGFRMFTGDDPDAIRKSSHELESVLGRVRTIDNQFFDQVQTVLADEQLERLPAVRRARERSRYQRGMSRMAGFMNPGARVDLSEFADDLDVSPDLRAAMRATLDSYERRLTTMAQRLHDAATNLPQVINDKMQAAGLSAESFRDRGQRDAVFALWRESQDELAAKAAELSELNRRTYGQMIGLLPDDAAMQLRREYLGQAYGEAPSDRGPAARQLKAALALDSITDGQRSQIDGEGQSYRPRIDRVVDEMLDAIDENRMVSRLFRFNGDESPQQLKYRQTMEDLRGRFDEINATTIAAIAAVLGREAASVIAARSAEADDEEAMEGMVTATVMIAGGDGAVTSFSGTTLNVTLDASSFELSDPYLPPPISDRDLKSYARRLGLPDAMNDVLSSLHDDYRAQFDEVRGREIKAVHDVEQSMWSIVPGTEGSDRPEMKGPTPDDVERLFALRRKAMASINALDAAFFENVQAAALDDEQAPRLDRVRLARQRTVYNRAISGGAGPGGAMVALGGRGSVRGPQRFSIGGMSDSEEPGVDLSRLVEDLELPSDLQERVDPALLGYEQTITEVFRIRYEAATRLQEAMDKVSAASTTTSPDGTRRAMRLGGGSGFREVMENEGAAASDARQRLFDHNRAALAELRGLLPDDRADDLRRAYNLEAYPSVYNDPRSAEPKLASALGLPDLTSSQRNELSEIAMTFRAEYDALCEQLIDAAAANAGPGDFTDRNRWQAMQEQRRTTEKIRFDRDELSDKALVRFRAVLNADQLARLGGLDATGGE